LQDPTKRILARTRAERRHTMTIETPSSTLSSPSAPNRERLRNVQPLPPVSVTPLPGRSVPILEQKIRSLAAPRPLRILEAGCGGRWPLDLKGESYTLTGVDLDSVALERRKNVSKDMDEIIVGDLRTTDLFAANAFDVIYNSFVLEHVAGAEHVLENFLRWLKPGGILILRIPDRNSVYGFLTRFTPFWVHVLVKKHLQGMPNAGKPGFDPYPTHYDPVVSRTGVHEYCSRRGCTVVYESAYSGYLPKGLVGALARVVVRTISALSLGRLDWRYNNLTFVIEKS
jgi:SAM-dependent methyltransferase